MLISASLLIASLFDYTYAPSLLIANAIISYLFLSTSLEIAALIVVPSLLANIIGRKGKYQTLLIFLFSSLALTYLLFQQIKFEDLLIYALIATFYCFIPSPLIQHIKTHIYNPHFQYHQYVKKMKEVESSLKDELLHISSLFDLVALQYQSEEETKKNRKRTEQVYRDLCINCPKNKICYQSGDVTLLKLFFKNVEDELNKNEELIVSQNCLKPSRFFALGEEYKNEYFRDYKYNAEYQELKKALSKQVLGFKELIDRYKERLNVESQLEFNVEAKRIRDGLEQNHFEVIYVNYQPGLNEQINLELGIKVDQQEEINYKVLQIIETILDIDLQVEDIHLSSAENYYKVAITSRRDYQITHGIHQLHKENHASGDSYLALTSKNHQIYALSDGMGSGKEAQNESRTTLKLLRGLIETGMSLGYGIGMINSLLKIKNRYDNYATLDILSINHRNLKACFTKNGASHSYILRQKSLICIDITSLPVGIVEDLDAYSFEYHLNKDDLIIMFSDGIKCSKEELEKYVVNLMSCSPQIIAREIATRFANKYNSDDTTVMVIKITQKTPVKV